jgi:hypothetical protein
MRRLVITSPGGGLIRLVKNRTIRMLRRWLCLTGIIALRLAAQGASGTVVQEAYVKASNTGASDSFGYAVAISGNTVVVGSAGENGAASGVNGDQSLEGLPTIGAAYVLVRIGTNWVQQAYLKASNPAPQDQFGASVAISEDTIVVGAPGEDSGSAGINGDQNSNAAAGSGAAYVFVRTGTNWAQQAYLKPSNTAIVQHFGNSVGISSDLIIVGAPGESSNSAGVNGAQNNTLSLNSGAAYIFFRSGTNWGQEAYLKASNTGANDGFGEAVSISGNTALAGARGESSDGRGVNGTQSNNNANQSGAGYVLFGPAQIGVNKLI